MIRSDKAYTLARTKAKALCNPYEPRLATDMPIKMPGGWRVPFDVYVQRDRLEHGVVILFVHGKTGEVEVEWNDVEGIDHNSIFEYQQQNQGLPQFSDIQDKLHHEHPELQIETVQSVLDTSPENRIQLYWRMGLKDDRSNRYVIMGGFARDGTIYCTKPELHSKGVIPKLNIGRSRYNPQSGNMTIRFRDLPANQTDLLSRWMVWSCMAHTTEYLSELGYREVGPHNILLELIEDEIKGAEFSEGTKFSDREIIPVISLSRSGGWADDPTIICHELGHAVWYLLFTRPAKSIVESIKKEEYNCIYEGIREGFADYFAATLLVRQRKTRHIEIGENLPEKTRDLHKGILPRPLDGHPREIPADLTYKKQKEYRIGMKWANLLWNLRQCIGAHKADDIIFRAHFKPLVSDYAPTEPLAAYFQSLMKTANYFKIDFNGWDKLAREHKITLPSV